MDDVSTEKRLRLLKQIRARYREDQMDLSNRERILYGRSSRPLAEDPDLFLEDPPEQTEPNTSFRIRLALAAGLLGLAILMDMKGTSVAGITSENIFQAISADFQETIDTWAPELLQPSEEPAEGVL